MKVNACPHHADTHSHWLPKLDALGSAAAFICALHCALLPLLLVALPLTAAGLLADHRIERVFVVMAIGFGALVISSGLSYSQRRLVPGLFLAGIACLLAGIYFESAPGWHALSMTLGGFALGGAHAVNRYSVRIRSDAFSLWKSLKPAPGAAP